MGGGKSGRISHFQGIGFQLLIFKSGKLTQPLFVALGEQPLSEGTQSQKRLFIWFCLLFVLMATEEVYSQTKQTLSFLCTGKTVDSAVSVLENVSFKPTLTSEDRK